MVVHIGIDMERVRVVVAAGALRVMILSPNPEPADNQGTSIAGESNEKIETNKGMKMKMKTGQGGHGGEVMDGVVRSGAARTHRRATVGRAERRGTGAETT